MTSKTFALSGFLYRESEDIVGQFNLIGWTSDAGTTPALTMSDVNEIICDHDIKDAIAFPTNAFPNVNKIQIRNWQSLATFAPNATVQATLNELEISNTQVNAITGTYTALSDLILIENAYLTNVQSTMNALVRLILVNCPIQELKTALPACTTLHLERTSITTLPTTYTAVKYIFVAPRFRDEKFTTTHLSNVAIIIARQDVILFTHTNTHVSRTPVNRI